MVQLLNLCGFTPMHFGTDGWFIGVKTCHGKNYV